MTRRARGIARAAVVGAALAGAALAAPDAADAQPVGVTVERDGAPEGGVSVFSFVNGIKTRRGTTGSDGTATVDPADLGARPGDTVDVVRTCADGRVQIVLQRRGEEGDPCADQEAAAGEECECRRIGAFVVGDGPVTIDVGRGVVTQAARGTAGDFRIGVGIQALYFERFGDVANRQPGLVSGDAGNWGYSPYLSLDYDFARLPLGLGLRAGYGKAPDVDQTYGGGRAEITTDFFSLNPVIRATPHPDLDLRLGVEWMYNRISIAHVADLIDIPDIDRNRGNFNGYFGLGYRRSVGDGLTLEAGASYSTNFSGNDADSGIFGMSAGVQAESWW